jgi:hypothetical protein
MGQKNTYKILAGKSKGKDHYKELGVEERKVLREILQK